MVSIQALINSACFRLRAKPVRTASGIAVVAVMSKPHRCPHIATTGNICVYCPGGPDSDFEYSTQSYTGYEPTSMRAIRARYNPYVQARARVDQLRKLGHSVDKVSQLCPSVTCLCCVTLPYARNLSLPVNFFCACIVLHVKSAGILRPSCASQTAGTDHAEYSNSHMQPKRCMSLLLQSIVHEQT